MTWSELVWTCLNLFELLWKISDMFSHVYNLNQLEALEPVWTGLNHSKQDWTSFKCEQFINVWTGSNILEIVWIRLSKRDLFARSEFIFIKSGAEACAKISKLLYRIWTNFVEFCQTYEKCLFYKVCVQKLKFCADSRKLFVDMRPHVRAFYKLWFELFWTSLNRAKPMWNRLN